MMTREGLIERAIDSLMTAEVEADASDDKSLRAEVYSRIGHAYALLAAIVPSDSEDDLRP